jgi:hypothetical protein
MRQNITPLHYQNKKEKRLGCELENVTQDIEKIGNQHADDM